MKMLIGHQSYGRRALVFVSLAVLLVAVFLLWNHRVGASASGRAQAAVIQVESHDVGSQMADYMKRGRYDDAVQVGLHALRNQPSDELILEEIATVYLVRAQKEPEQREHWVATALSYTDKALLLNSKDRDAAGVHLFQHARSYEMAGDLSAAERCADYERARKLLENRVSLLQGDHLTLEGKDYPLGPVRKENEKALAEVKAKAEKAECK
jgi:tetratricopeptide (TPR) repeat protein